MHDNNTRVKGTQEPARFRYAQKINTPKQLTHLKSQTCVQMNTPAKIQPSSSSQSTKTAHQPTDSASSKPLKSIYRVLRDAGFRSMNDFMFSYGLKLHNDEHLAQAKEMIERMKEEDLMGTEMGRVLSGEGSGGNADVDVDRGMVDDDDFGEAFGYDYVGDGDNDGYGDVYDDQDEFEDDFEDGFEND
ncbi:hypothetical protein BCON_0056g00420 [Botryotinia convoluta]|uniref:Uncharacterized protein n=1 Tax=Botryotinia convoluta TaxID=54673 RepID=A0A4Z1IGS7_9HELO|nr:hypothetical protein BCON_0056g00420 [Botryotinia convoluta]